MLDAADARRVAGMLGVPFYVLNFEQDFGRVIDYFVDEYNRGRTPNPCVRCNDWLKFGKLAQYAKAVGADYVASGHYARVGTDPATGRRALMRGLDHRKDQSYVLFGMSREALAHTLLPIGGYEKHAVRAIAEELRLPVFNKPDSQEICFVPNQDYAGLVRRRSPETFRAGRAGPAGWRGRRAARGAPAFHDRPAQGRRRRLAAPAVRARHRPGGQPRHRRPTGEPARPALVARQINLLDDALRPGGGPVRCTAKIRYNSPPQPAEATVTGDDEITVRFDEPQSAITAGQAVVLYDGDAVLGGGWIDSVG